MIRADGQLSRGPAGAWSRFPWWLLALGLAMALFLLRAATSQSYAQIFHMLLSGLGITVGVTLVTFPLALGLGLWIALELLSQNPLRRNLATLYVQIARGLPVLVQIFLVVFVVVPAGVEAFKALAGLVGVHPDFRVADIPMVARVVLALAFAYGAFEAETLRGGLTSLARGQAEASRALGLSRGETLRHVLLPQTFRRVLPTLGNDLISLLKDSSLVSVLGVADITQQARNYASATFHYTESLTLLALFYLTLTLLLSLGIKGLEQRYRRHGA